MRVELPAWAFGHFTVLLGCLAAGLFRKGGFTHMPRALAVAIFAFAGLSAALWAVAMRWLYASPYSLWCGNVISDPFALLVNVVGPLAAACAVILAGGCIKARRWPRLAVAALITFVITSACLAYEHHVLGLYGLETGRVWWLPWR
jgi:NADH:ubiquinone oxidoreductase subunit 2 (subunit N)